MSTCFIAPSRLAMAYLLDLLTGDPEWFPHPVRGIGWAVSTRERMLRRPTDSDRTEFVKGALLTGSIVASAWAVSREVLRRAELLSRRVPNSWKFCWRGRHSRRAVYSVKPRRL